MSERIAFTAQHARFLRDLFPGEGCLTAAEEVLAYGADAGRRPGRPWAVVRPRERGQVARLLAWAQAEGLPIITRGRGTNVVGGCAPLLPGPAADWTDGGIVVSTLWLDRIVEIHAQDFVAVVEPGVVTGDLQERLKRRGLFYPPDPASARLSTVGGNVATGAGGMRAVKYGVTRDYVLGLEAVLPGGRTVRLGGRAHKNAVGLDLARLFVGSEGTLGIITEITLKLLPLPEASATLLAAFDSLEAALAGAGAVFGAGVLPTALELLAEETLACLARFEPAHPLPWPEGTRAVLLLRLDGSRETLPAETDRLRAVLRDARTTLQAATPADEERLWEIRRQINPASFRVAPAKLSDDVTVPRSQCPALIRGCRDIGKRLGLTILTFGHLGDGNIHVNVMHDPAAGQGPAAAQAKREVAGLTLALGGTLSGEHGVGLSKLPLLDRQLGPEERTLMRGVKAVFDPLNIMNPGKAY